MSDETAQPEHWWEAGPIFSTTDRSSKITTIAPGEEIGRFTPGIAVMALLTAASWTGLAFMGYPRLIGADEVSPAFDEPASHWWWIALTVLGVVLMFPTTGGLYGALRKRFRQQSAGLTVCFTAASLGFVVAGLIHLRLTVRYLDSLPPEAPSSERPGTTFLLVLTGLALIVFVGGAVRTPFLLFRIRRRQRSIVELRRSGFRYAGEVAGTEFDRRWVDRWPQFKVTIRYEGPNPENTFDAVMTTQSHRVPLPGYPVVVSVGEQGTTLVEPDPERPGEFDRDYDQYVEPSGDGGGGGG
ncbi:hypothetical protein [Glycomyces sp. NRRL B-16210]|uniref:hypothetical protein n=1 Tax=Glycomyces sp. NRRL B-16210 TaxID=1463821 RepID=UPI00054F061C|nr:hypothetical protein [Glycomyces sp. NRRL B-16210]